MKIRRATLEDQAKVFELLNELRKSGYREMGEAFKETPTTEMAVHKYFELVDKKGVYIFVADHDGEVVGLCVVYEIPKILDGNNRLLIEEMVIAPEFRGQGIGSKMIEFVEKMAGEIGIMYIKVTTGTKLKANSFYQKHGYVHFENAYRKKIEK